MNDGGSLPETSPCPAGEVENFLREELPSDEIDDVLVLDDPLSAQPDKDKLDPAHTKVN